MTGILKKEAIELIDAKNFGYLATSMPDGWPQVTPVWIDHDGDDILVNTKVGQLKERNIKRDPRVAIVIPDKLNPNIRLIVRGIAEGTSIGAEAHLDKLTRKYKALERYPAERKGIHRGVRVILRIKPKHVDFASDDWSDDFHTWCYHEKSS